MSATRCACSCCTPMSSVASSISRVCGDEDILYPPSYTSFEDGTVAHTIEDKTRLLQRVRRLRGQVDAIERALERDADCARVMQLTVSARGAANGLMAELLEDHIRMHVSDPARDRDRACTRRQAPHRHRARLSEVGYRALVPIPAERL